MLSVTWGIVAAHRPPHNDIPEHMALYNDTWGKWPGEIPISWQMLIEEGCHHGQKTVQVENSFIGKRKKASSCPKLHCCKSKAILLRSTMYSPLFFAVPKLFVINMHAGNSKQSLCSWLVLAHCKYIFILILMYIFIAIHQTVTTCTGLLGFI